jgi:hypothetical protein
MLKEKVTKLGTMMMATDMQKQGNHHFWSFQAQINVKMAPMHMGIYAFKVSYGKKQVSSWQITPNTVEITTVMPATDAKNARESRINVKMATMYTGIEASKVGYEEKQDNSWQILAEAVELRMQQ